MDRDANPLIVAALFLARCLVPLLIMLAVSYLLKRWRWLPETPPPPANGDRRPPGASGPSLGPDTREGGQPDGKV